MLFQSMQHEVYTYTFRDANESESEEHFLIRCEQYTDIRLTLFQLACDIEENFMSMSDTEKLIFVLSHPEIVYVSAKAVCDMLKRRRCLVY